MSDNNELIVKCQDADDKRFVKIVVKVATWVYDNWAVLSVFFVILSTIGGWAYNQHLHVLRQDTQIMMIQNGYKNLQMQNEDFVKELKKVQIKLKMVEKEEQKKD